MMVEQNFTFCATNKVAHSIEAAVAECWIRFRCKTFGITPVDCQICFKCPIQRDLLEFLLFADMFGLLSTSHARALSGEAYGGVGFGVSSFSTH